MPNQSNHFSIYFSRPPAAAFRHLNTLGSYNGTPHREKQVNLIDRYLAELLNAGNFTSASEILAPDFVFYGPSTPQGLDADGFRDFIKETRAAFSNKRFTELDRIVEGDRVALRFRMTGTQDGMFCGIPPTGATLDTEGCDIIYIRGERITEVRAYFDLMATVQRILMPIPGKIIGGLIGTLFPQSSRGHKFG
jgi:steroid delta-isomerase-like uncharacterized protein